MTPASRAPALAHLARRRAAHAAALAVALVLVATTPALAHDQLESTDPADGSTLTAAPTALTLVFSERVLDISTTVVLVGPAGEVPTTIAVDGSTVMATPTGDQPNGTYSVTWRVVSSDGHPVQGTFGYALAVPAPTATAAPAPTATPEATPTTTSTPPNTSPSTAPSPAPSTATGTATGTGTTTHATRSVAPAIAIAALVVAALAAAVAWGRHRTSREER